MVLQLQCGHSQRGSRRGERGPSGNKEETGVRVGKKGKNGMSTRVVRGWRYQRECSFPFDPRAHLCSFKFCLRWQEELAEQGPESPLLGGVSPFQHCSLSAVVHRCPVVRSAGCCRNKIMCPENLCISLIRWFVLSLGSGTCPSKGWELMTLFLACRICPSSTVPWLWEDSDCVSCRLLTLGGWFSLLQGFRAWFCFAVLCMYQEVCGLIQCWLGPRLTLQGFSLC